MKPLLAHVYEPHRVSYPCYVQPKLNGVRALYQNGFFQSRDELPWNEHILRHLADVLKPIFKPEIILDGELYVHGWPLQRINGAITPVRNSTNVDSRSVNYHIFDRVAFGDSFQERWHSLPHGIQLDSVCFVPTILVKNFQEANALYSKWVGEGYEGMMYRLGDCPYTRPKQETVSINGRTSSGGYFCEDGIKPPGRLKFWADQDNRTWHLLKRKSWQDDEYTITDFTLTTGEKGEIGFQLTCVTKEGLSFNVGSGLSNADRDYYAEHSPVGRKAKIKYLCLSEKGIPLNPTILAIL